MKKDNKINKQITSLKVRVIDQNGKMLGVLNTNEALKIAFNLNLDLVEVASNSNPPVCKILDFKKFLYESKKHFHEAKKNQKKHKNLLKEIKLKINIASGDLDIKIQKIRKFLEERNKVKISLLFKGREIVHKERGFNLLEQIRIQTNEISQNAEASTPKLEGRQIVMILSPISQKK